MNELLQIEPQVARGKFTELIWEDSGYLAEEKLDGERFKLHVFKDGNRFDSRCLSKKTGLFTEKTGNVPHLANFKIPELDGTVLDGEIKFGDDSMSTSTIMGCLPEEAVERQKNAGKWVSYYIFDVIFYKGNSVRHLSYANRKMLVDEIYVKYFRANTHFRIPPYTYKNKKAFCETIWKAGGEGVILKRLDAPYTDKTGWIKVKRASTYDVVVMGYVDANQMTLKKGDDKETISRLAAKGWIGALEFGQYVDGKLRKFGQCSGMPDDIRQLFSENKQSMLYAVITIEAQSRIPKTSYFRHPRFLRMRPDKLARQCVYWANES